MLHCDYHVMVIIGCMGEISDPKRDNRQADEIQDKGSMCQVVHVPVQEAEA